MAYQKLQPPDILKPYIESVWIQEELSFDPGWEPTRIIPTTKADIIFYYHDPFVLHNRDSKDTIPMAVLHGPITRPMQVSASGKTGLIIFSFYPWGIASFMDIPCDELTDQTIDLRSIFGAPAIHELHSRIMEADNNKARVDLIQYFFIKNLCRKKTDNVAVLLAHTINKKSGCIKWDSLASHFGFSRRHLQRRFSAMIGLSPKKFAGIIRFQKALYLKRSGFHWADIAEHCGYFDQSHFIRDINNYSGCTPQQIYSNIKPTRLMSYFNSFESMSQFYNTIYL